MNQNDILASLELSTNIVEVGSTSLPKRNPSQGESVGNYIVNAIKSGKQVLFFLGGEAGTGKTTCIREITEIIKKSLPNMNVTLLAPTHSVVAQLPAGAATCHSTARLSHPENPFPIIPKKDPNYEKRMGVTIVDEISLLSGASFAEWDEINRKRTGKYQIFGGMHMIIIGDLLQLQMGDDGQQISEAHLLDKFEFYELQEIHRQDRDPIFRGFLKRAQTVDLNSSMLKFINDRLTPRGVGYLTGTVDKFLEIHDDHTHVLTSTHKRRKAFNDAIIAEKFQKTEVLHEQIQCIRGANTTLSYEPVPKSDTFRTAEGMRVVTTATMMDKDGENVSNGTMDTVKSFTTLRDHVHFVNIQFNGSQKTQRFGRKNPDGTNVFTFNFQPAYALTYHRAEGRTMSGVILDLHGRMSAGAFYTGVSRVRDASRVFFNCRIGSLFKLKTIILHPLRFVQICTQHNFF